MSKLYLTVPVISRKPLAVIAPTFEAMALDGLHEEMLYGLYGSNSAKGPVLNAAYAKADKGDAILMKKAFYYLVDVVMATPPNFDESKLEGPLHRDQIGQVPFLVTKRLSRDCAGDLGVMWHEWATEIYGAATISRHQVDWTNALSFIPTFPLVVERLFAKFPKLRCAILPMYWRTPDGSRALTWVGVLPKAKAARWIDHAEVRMQPEIAVDLSFK